MEKLRKLLAASVLTTVSVLGLHAATLSGVTLPDDAAIGNTKLVLNGLGLRTKFLIKVYVGGLYLEKKSSDADSVIKSDSPKRIVLHFLHDVSKTQMADAMSEAFGNNAPDASRSMKAEIDQLLGALEPVKEGDEMTFTYLPGTGLTLAINGKDKVTIAPAAFRVPIFAGWLGPKPPNAGLKKGMLGQ